MAADDRQRVGLSTTEALAKLLDEIRDTSRAYEAAPGYFKRLPNLISTYNMSTCTHWLSLLGHCTAVICFVLDEQFVCAALLLLILACGMWLDAHESRLHRLEIVQRVRNVCNMYLQPQLKVSPWPTDRYYALRQPFSPCINLQWCYRDGRLVNVPSSLLVRDDIVVMRPGQQSAVHCERLDMPEFILRPKEFYGPGDRKRPTYEMSAFRGPRLHTPRSNVQFRVLSTPYIENLRLFLERGATRPLSQFQRQRHLLFTYIDELVVLPIAFFIALLAVLLRSFYWQLDWNIADYAALFTPALGVAVPIAWYLGTYVALARFYTLFERFEHMEKPSDETTAVILEEDEVNDVYVDITVSWMHVGRKLMQVWRGHADILWRSANLMHVLGSVTALGCVDKKGVLSWPNPIAEKAFFMNRDPYNSGTSSMENVILNPAAAASTADGDSGTMSPPGHQSRTFHAQGDFATTTASTAIVMDLTHMRHDPSALQFDDPNWRRFLASLKPIGLGILLNTCNEQTQEQYGTFCSHVTYEAMYHENLVPVTSRRCLCQLSREIGFMEQAKHVFNPVHTMAAFRHLQADVVKRGNKCARSLPTSTRVKFPFPHMFTVIARELATSSFQLFTEGTADIVLDMCVDYWNGKDLCTLTALDRKRAQEFYQRNSLTAYCTAFSYRPLLQTVTENGKPLYLELPSATGRDRRSHESGSMEAATTQRVPVMLHQDSEEGRRIAFESTWRSLGHFHSTDSLLYGDEPAPDLTDASGYLQVQKDQVFIGMVAMQYQVLSDMVQLIEQLERACIRFVHFSKENELRSRVFSEKMGLESGWNCHISLSNNKSGSHGNLNAAAQNQMNRRLSQSQRKISTSRSEHLLWRKGSSKSAPGALNDPDDMEMLLRPSYNDSSRSPPSGARSPKETAPTAPSQSSSGGVAELPQPWRKSISLASYFSDTSDSSDSVPVNFDMSNRAKLPCGVDNIRPHIERIDNVPLLVSLFTDCTPPTTCEMLKIMQEYGEIVCILGSSANSDNAPIFMQSDAAIAIEPLPPYLCHNARQETGKRKTTKNNCPTLGPNELASRLNAVPCSLLFRRDDSVSIYRLIMEARHFKERLWNCLQFWMLCCACVCFAQLPLALILPHTMLSPLQTIWLCSVVIPLLSTSLMVPLLGRRSELLELMRQPQSRTQTDFQWDQLHYVSWCFGGRLVVTLFITWLSFITIMLSNCAWSCPTSDETIHVARTMTQTIFALHFVTMSVGFVNRNHLIMEWRSWSHSYTWILVSTFIIMVQVIYTSYVLWLPQLSNTNDQAAFINIPLWLWMCILMSPLLVLLSNEWIKREEIRLNQRFQKRTRLNFGTKLGMNSPF